jgi:hypothetical protein
MSTIERPFHKGDFAHEQLMRQTIQALPDGWYDISITPKGDKCCKARGYLHGLIVPIYGIYMGEVNRGAAYDDEVTWGMVKKKFNPQQYIDPDTGEVEVVGGSTKGWNKARIIEFTQTIRDWLTKQGIGTPDPDKNWKEKRERAKDISHGIVQPSNADRQPDAGRGASRPPERHNAVRVWSGVQPSLQEGGRQRR